MPELIETSEFQQNVEAAHETARACTCINAHVRGEARPLQLLQ